jgi:23S rRNA (cytidine1920-2'-O)/16S rRNA (cytidine1409-2'-O)-methyltransferase
MKKVRLDHKVQELYPDLSKTQIQSFIMQGKVFVDPAYAKATADKRSIAGPLTKPGMKVPVDAKIIVNYDPPKYVSRAGLKLEKALDAFGVNPQGLTVLDAGLSTGGFTDCLLQRGAAKIYGIDVGYGQVHEKIRSNPCVVVKERVNLRTFDEPIQVDMVTLDLSFISVLKVMDTVSRVLKPNGILMVLIKPQFEAEKHEVGKGGIIKSPAVHEAVIQKSKEGIQKYGFIFKGLIESPILGTHGNKEFLAYFIKRPA